MTDNERDEASAGLAWLTVTLPSAFTFVGCMLLVGVGGMRSLAESTQEMGAGFYVASFGAFVAIMISSAMLYLMARGRRVPSFMLLGVGVLPWLVGVAMARYGQNLVMQALGHASPDMRNSLLAQGAAEAMIVESYGALLSSALLAASGVGLGLAAFAQRAPGRSALGALFGALALAPLGAAIAIASAAGHGGWLALLPGLGALLGLAFAGAGLGKGEDKTLSAPLSSSVPVFFALSLYAMGSSLSIHAMQMALAAMAAADPSSRLIFAVRGLVEANASLNYGALGAGATLLLGAGLVAWGATRVPYSIRRFAGAMGLSFVALMGAGLPFAPSTIERVAREALARGGSGALTPLVSAQGVPTTSEAPDLYLAPDGLHDKSFGPLIASDADAMHAKLAEIRALHGVLRTRRGDNEHGACGRVAYDAPRMGLAAGVPANTLTAFARAAAMADMDSVVFVGQASATDHRPELDDLADRYPVLALIVAQPFSEVAVAMGSAHAQRCFTQQARQLDSDADGAVLGAIGMGGARSHASSSEGQQAMDLAWVHLTNEMTSEDVFATAHRLGAGPLRMVMSADAAPDEASDREATDDSAPGAEPAGTQGQPSTAGGILGRLGSAAPAPPQGGSLPRAVIQRVIHSHMSEIRYCYERELSRDPQLEGRVVVRFTVGPSGEVQASTVQTTTLANEAAEHCIVQASRRWVFPAPAGGGIVTISYPFVLRPGR